MKIIMVAVVSANGKLTRGNDPDIYKWTSKEDREFFFDKIAKSKLIIMGSWTYEAVRRQIKHSSNKLRIILTKSPGKYKSEQVEGALEFTSETPSQLINRLIDYKEMLLVGGSKIYSSFLKEGLVDEIYLTIEPVLFGKGKNLISERELETNLELTSIEKLNQKGTILAKYKIIK